jgi:hypothetical protein
MKNSSKVLLVFGIAILILVVAIAVIAGMAIGSKI